MKILYKSKIVKLYIRYKNFANVFLLLQVSYLSCLDSLLGANYDINITYFNYKTNKTAQFKDRSFRSKGVSSRVF